MDDLPEVDPADLAAAAKDGFHEDTELQDEDADPEPEPDPESGQ